MLALFPHTRGIELPRDVDGIAVSYRNLGNYLWNTTVPPTVPCPEWPCSSGCVSRVSAAASVTAANTMNPPVKRTKQIRAARLASIELAHRPSVPYRSGVTRPPAR